MKTVHKPEPTPERDPADEWGPPLLLMPILVLIAGISLAALVQLVGEQPAELMDMTPPEATAMVQPSH